MAEQDFNRGRSLMKRITLALGVALAALVAAAPSTARPTAATATTVTVKMSEFKFVLSKKVVPHGTVTFKLVNRGTISHDFSIAGKKSKQVKKGKTLLFTVKLSAGKKAYKCTIAGHAAAGMKGRLTVT
jgi:plastocyanin